MFTSAHNIKKTLPLASIATLALFNIQVSSVKADTHPASSSSSASPGQFKVIRETISNIIETDAEKRGDGTSLKGTFVRLAWHCAGTYSIQDHSGGSNGGRIRFRPEASWGANAGLKNAREALEPVKTKFPTLSYADLYTLAGVVAIESAGGPTIPYRLGREDMASGATSPSESRLPDANKGTHSRNIQHIRQVFSRLGFNDRETVALLGAHALGRCHTNASGYWGPWTYAENAMSNEYFRLLIEERWVVKVSHNGRPWTGPEQYENSSGELMMLPSDLALIHDPKLKIYVELYAKDEDAFFRDFASAFSKLLELGVSLPVQKWYKFW